MVQQSYHDNTGHNDVFVDVFKTMATKSRKFPVKKYKSLPKKAVNKNTVKTRGQKARATTTTLLNTKLKSWTNVSRASLPKFAKAMAPTMSRAA